jgi:hypothetical protein
MPDNLENHPSNANPNGENRVDSLTPESIKKISDMVYQMLMEDLRIEKERTGFGSKSNLSGGW